MPWNPEKTQIMGVALIKILIPALFCSAVLTAVVRRIAIGRGFVSIPRADRYNRKVIALGGGIAIFITIAGFITAAAAAGAAFSLDKTDIHDFTIIGALVAVLFALGLIDDIKRLGPYSKLFVQFAAAIAAALWADVRVEMFIHSKIITVTLSAFWMVLLMNAFNFLDNMDGLSAGIAIICLSVLCSAAYVGGQSGNAMFMVLVIGSLCGFLIFNFPPAKIFMGDAGSLVIGFCVGAMTIKTTYYHQDGGECSRAAIFIPLVATAVPLYDFISVTALRIRQGKSPFVGDTQHFSHRLKRRGLSDKQVAFTLYLATLCTGLGAVFLSYATIAQAVIVFIQTVMILSIIAILEMTGAKCESDD